LRHSSYDPRQKKKAAKTYKSTRYHLSTKGNKRGKIIEFFSPRTICAHISEAEGDDWGERGLSAEGPADGARGARGKRDLETNTFNP